MSDVNDTSLAEKLILRALIISLLIHALVFCTWRMGKAQGWFHNMGLPRWMQMVSNAVVPIAPKRLVPAPQPATPLMFVEVDPALASPKPPEAPKFYGANNTLAANPQITTPSTVPDIRGRQDKEMKTTDNGKPKAQPLQPTPPPQPTAAASKAVKSDTPGELALAQPAKKTQEKDGKADTATDAQPQPAYQRPRTIAEAMARNGTLGEKMRQKGGVAMNNVDSSLDVKGTSLGAYDALFVEAVKARWYQLLENRTPNAPGKVILEFKLHPDGRITDMKMAQNDVSDLLGTLCEQAVLDPAPYAPWPTQMRLDIPADYRELRFTFFYDVY
jgi:hypothetical protein